VVVEESGETMMEEKQLRGGESGNIDILKSRDLFTYLLAHSIKSAYN